MSSQTRVITASNLVDGTLYCKCGTPAPERTSGPNTKNPGRKFFSCAKDRDDGENCRFFKWRDQVFNDDGTPKAGAAPTPTSSQTGQQGPPTPSNFKQPAPPGGRSAPTTPRKQLGSGSPEKNAAAVAARRAMIDKAIADAKADDAGKTPTTIITAGTATTPIQPSQAPITPAITPITSNALHRHDEDEDGMELDRASQMNDSPSISPFANPMRPPSRATTYYSIEVDDEGSPRKRQRPLPSTEYTPSSVDFDFSDNRAGPSNFQHAQFSQISRSGSGLRSPTSSSVTSSSQQTDSILAALDSIPDHLRMLERLKSRAELSAKQATSKAANLETELEMVKAEMEEYKIRCDDLQRKNRDLHEQLAHLRTGAADYD